MSYCIRYSPELNPKYPPARKGNRKALRLAAAALLCGALLLGAFSLWARSGASQWAAYHREKLEIMAEKISRGEPVRQAFAEYVVQLLRDDEAY